MRSRFATLTIVLASLCTPAFAGTSWGGSHHGDRDGRDHVNESRDQWGNDWNDGWGSNSWGSHGSNEGRGQSGWDEDCERIARECEQNHEHSAHGWGWGDDRSGHQRWDFGELSGRFGNGGHSGHGSDDWSYCEPGGDTPGRHGTPPGPVTGVPTPGAAFAGLTMMGLLLVGRGRKERATA